MIRKPLYSPLPCRSGGATGGIYLGSAPLYDHGPYEPRRTG